MTELEELKKIVIEIRKTNQLLIASLKRKDPNIELLEEYKKVKNVK